MVERDCGNLGHYSRSILYSGLLRGAYGIIKVGNIKWLQTGEVYFGNDLELPRLKKMKLTTKQKKAIDKDLGYIYERHGYPEPEEAKTWTYKQKNIFLAKCDAYEIDEFDRQNEQDAINTRFGKNI